MARCADLACGVVDSLLDLGLRILVRQRVFVAHRSIAAQVQGSLEAGARREPLRFELLGQRTVSRTIQRQALLFF